FPAVDPSSPACCLYGNNGVVISHVSIVRLLTTDRPPFVFGPSDVWSMLHSYAEDLSAWELFGCLAHGGRVVIVHGDERRNAEKLGQTIKREGVTVLNCARERFDEIACLDMPDQLHAVVLSGRGRLPATLGEWMKRHPHVDVVNAYGMAETGIHAIVRAVTAEDAA